MFMLLSVGGGQFLNISYVPIIQCCSFFPIFKTYELLLITKINNPFGRPILSNLCVVNQFHF